MSEFLRMENVTKQFGSLVANDKVNLVINRGEVHTLLGENGAGKSTLMNILIGLYQPTSGSIYVEGEKVKIDSPSTAVKYGIGMVHQHFMLVEAMTVFENIILGSTNEKTVFIKKDKIKKEILELSAKYGLDVDLDKLVTEISVGEQQRVEIIKALYRGAELLILDEPSAALTDEEVVGLFEIMRKLIRENKAIIFISHKMREVIEISDKVSILRSGAVVGTITREEASAEGLASMMIGRDMVTSTYEKVDATKNEKIIELSHVDYNPHLKHNGLSDVSLNIAKGEILGIAGVDGNGQSQLAQIVTGIIKAQKGDVVLKSQKIQKCCPNRFIEQRVAHIPEDRNKMGLVGDMTICENIVLKTTEDCRFSVKKGLRLKHKEIKNYAEKMKEKYDIRCTSIEQCAKDLSGGNQQKIILARELEEQPDLLVAVHPTRGLDIGATQYVHDTMIAARDRGCAILLISADFDEVLKLSDRIAVMFEGKIMDTYSGINPPVKQISLAMAGKE